LLVAFLGSKYKVKPEEMHTFFVFLVTSSDFGGTLTRTTSHVSENSDILTDHKRTDPRAVEKLRFDLNTTQWWQWSHTFWEVPHLKFVCQL
jgi:hypothetical protein